MVISTVFALQAAFAALCAPGASALTFSSLLPTLSPPRLFLLGVTTPTPIQAAFLVLSESLVLHAETRSGKSLAFLLPARTSRPRGGHRGASARRQLGQNSCGCPNA